MDWTAIVVALIGFAGVCVGTVAGFKKMQKKSEIADAVREQRQNDRFDRIDEKIERLERTTEKFGSVEVLLKGMQKDIEYLKSDRCKQKEETCSKTY